jgi:Tfp pilus assembly protein PilO
MEGRKDNGFRTVLNAIGSRRWEAGFAAFTAVCVVFAGSVVVPVVRGGIEHIAAVKQARQSLASAGRLPRRIDEARVRAVHLDSLLHAFETRLPFLEATVVEYIYQLADSAGCIAAKVTIGNPVAAGAGVEIPFVLTGRGTYKAMGEFIEGIENMNCVTRIRQCTINRRSNTEGDLVLDFVVIEEKS